MLDKAKCLFGFLFILSIVAFLSVACGGRAEESPGRVFEAEPLDVIVPPSAPDLLMGETHVEAYGDAYLNYQIVATIENAGAGDASGFNAGCTYQCPPGNLTTSGGLDIVQAGFIPAKGSFTYRSPFHFMCESRPPTLNLTCDISSAQGGTKTYSVSVTLP